MTLSKFRLLPLFAAIALFAMITAWILPQPLNAQSDTEVGIESADLEEDEASEEEEVKSGDQSLIDMWKNGGWAMYPLTILSIAAFGLIVYNFMAVSVKQLLQPSLLPEIDAALKELDIERARSICD